MDHTRAEQQIVMSGRATAIDGKMGAYLLAEYSGTTRRGPEGPDIYHALRSRRSEIKPFDVLYAPRCLTSLYYSWCFEYTLKSYQSVTTRAICDNARSIGSS
jgi:hypothetical protein